MNTIKLKLEQTQLLLESERENKKFLASNHEKALETIQSLKNSSPCSCVTTSSNAKDFIQIITELTKLIEASREGGHNKEILSAIAELKEIQGKTKKTPDVIACSKQILETLTKAVKTGKVLSDAQPLIETLGKLLV